MATFPYAGSPASRRSVLRSAAALGGVAALQGAASGLGLILPRPALAQAQEFTTMRSTFKSWLWAAEDFGAAQDFFEEQGLNVVSNASGRGVNVNALIGGSVDVVLGSPDQAIRARAQGQPVVVIAGSVNKYASHVVIKADILAERGVDESASVEDKVEALRGLKLGTTGPGAAPDSLFRYLFSLGGMDPEQDAQLVSIQGGGSAILAALDQGVIEGFCLSSPTSDIAVQQFGGAYLFNMATNPPPALADYLYITVQASEDAIANKREQLLAYCKGLTVALRAIHDQTDLFRDWAQGFFEMEPAVFDAAFASNKNIYMQSPVPTERHFDLNRDFVNRGLAAIGEPPLPKDFGYADAYYPDIAKEADAAV